MVEITLVKAAGPGQHSPALEGLLARIDDETIALATRGASDLMRRWIAVPPGGTLRLSWPLTRDFGRETGPVSQPGAG